MDFATLRHEVWLANTRLPTTGLVVMHSGNASGVDREHGLVVIKPSGVDYETLRPEDLVVVRLDGEAITVADVPVWSSVAVTLAIIAGCMAVIAWMFKTGYRLKQ